MQSPEPNPYSPPKASLALRGDGKIPAARPTSWPMVCLLVGFLLVITLCLVTLFRPRDPSFLFAAVGLCFAVLTWALRRMLIPDLQEAVAAMRARRFLEAVRGFETAHETLQRRTWIDDYRWILLGVTSTMTLREIALCNAAFCYAQCGNSARAIAIYQDVLRQFPKSVTAATALKSVNPAPAPAPFSTPS